MLDDTLDEAQIMFDMTSKHVTSNELVTRKIVLPAHAFMSRQQLWQQLKGLSRSILINIDAVVNNKLLSAYFYNVCNTEEGLKKFSIAKVIGYQGPASNCWVLSDEIQIKDGKLQSELDRCYILSSKIPQEATLKVNEKLFSDYAYFNTTFSRILSMTQHFRENQVAVIHALAFTAVRLLSVTKKLNMAAAESKYAILSSKEKCVGKTTIQQIVARGQGISNAHPFFLAGGDGISCGTSLNKQMELLSTTNMVLLINELKVSSNAVASTLNQVHDSFTCGSISRGSKVPQASLLASSNDVTPHERLEGRVQVIRCAKSENFSTQDKDIIDRILQNFMGENKGFLLALCIHEGDLIQQLIERYANGIQREIDSLKGPKMQSRLVSALASNVVVVFMLMTYIDRPISAITIFKQMVSVENDTKSSMYDMWAELVELMKQNTEVATWFNPKTSFKDDNGKDVQAVAIRTTKLHILQDTKYNDIKTYVKSFGARAFSVNVRFCNEKDATMADLKKQEKCSAQKSCKFPWSVIPFDIVVEMAEVCSLEDVPGDNEESNGNSNHNFEDVTIIFDRIKMDCGQGGSQGGTGTTKRKIEDVLTPVSKKKYTEGCSKYKKGFRDALRSKKCLFVDEFETEDEQE